MNSRGQCGLLHFPYSCFFLKKINKPTSGSLTEFPINAVMCYCNLGQQAGYFICTEPFCGDKSAHSRAVQATGHFSLNLSGKETRVMTFQSPKSDSRGTNGICTGNPPHFLLPSLRQLNAAQLWTELPLLAAEPAPIFSPF